MTVAWPDAVLTRPEPAWLCDADHGWTTRLPVRRWHGRAGRAESRILAGIAGPVLDIGCGPGRHVALLAGAGIEALGIDTSAAAVESTRRRGGQASLVSIFGPVPSPGTWRAALLFDGNIGIGGDPRTLLSRVRELLRPGGRAVVEVEAPHVPSRRFVAVVRHAGGSGPGFPWALLSASDVTRVGLAAGFGSCLVRKEQNRWFADLT